MGLLVCGYSSFYLEEAFPDRHALAQMRFEIRIAAIEKTVDSDDGVVFPLIC